MHLRHSPLAAVMALTFVLASASCTPMRESAKTVRVGKEIPNPACREIGSIAGSSSAAYVTNETQVNIAQNKLRMKTEELGGNYALMDLVVAGGNGVSISGRAMSCPESTWAAPAAVPAVLAAAPDAGVPVASASGAEVAPDAAVVVSASGSVPDAAAPAQASHEERLRRLEDLKAKGLISAEEYSAKRQEILKDL